MLFLSPFSVLWLVLWAMVLFVVAPHLDPVCRSAARTVRVGSFRADRGPRDRARHRHGPPAGSQLGAEQLAAEVATLCPGASVGHTTELEAKFRASPASLRRG